MKTTVKFFTLILLLLMTSSCFIDGIKGNRNVVSQERNISSDFYAIDISQGIDVYLTITDDVSLSVEADENLQDIIITEVKDGTLHIYADKNIWSAKSRKVYLTAQEINEITTTSGASVMAENTINAEDFKVRATSGSDVRLQLNVATLSCKTTSGADARLRGKALNFTAKSTSGSDIRAKELETETCSVSVTSGANAYVNVTGSLSARASSGGDIKYIGDPKTVQQNSGSSGNIRKL